MPNEPTSTADAGPAPGTTPAPPASTPPAGGATLSPPRPRVAPRPSDGTPPAPAKRSALATAAMAAGGVAAGVAATLGGMAAVDALGEEPAAGALEDTVFDDVAPPEEGPTASAGGGGSGGGGGGGGGSSTRRVAPARHADDEASPVRREAPTADDGADGPIAMVDGRPAAVEADFETARQEVLERLEAWEAPDGADPEEAAALRAQLAGMVERFAPAAGQSVDDAVASLRDDVDQRVKNFAQDERIEAIVDELRQESGLDDAGLHDDFDDTVMTTMPVDDDADPIADDTETDPAEAEMTIMPVPEDLVDEPEIDVVGDAPAVDAPSVWDDADDTVIDLAVGDDAFVIEESWMRLDEMDDEPMYVADPPSEWEAEPPSFEGGMDDEPMPMPMDDELDAEPAMGALP